MITPVIYRTFLDGGDVIALFPFEPSDNAGHFCMSYQHVGQHGRANPLICRRPITRPSTPAEISGLVCELRGLGYKLRGLQRVPRNALAVRRKAIAEMDSQTRIWYDQTLCAGRFAPSGNTGARAGQPPLGPSGASNL